jgi:hypothetical protein
MEGMFMRETRRGFLKKKQGVDNRLLIAIAVNIQVLKG